MNIQKRTLQLLVGVLLWLQGSGAMGQSAVQSERILSATLPIAKVEALVKIAGNAPCIFDSTAYGWGVENTCPKEVITAVVVELGEKHG